MASKMDARLLKSTKFPLEFNKKVSMEKVQVGVVKQWIVKKTTEILGGEDDVVTELILNLLGKSGNPDIKSLQIQLTGFLDKDAASFCQELWALLLSAQDSRSGVPKELLEARKLELMQQEKNDANRNITRREREAPGLAAKDREYQPSRDEDRGDRRQVADSWRAPPHRGDRAYGQRGRHGAGRGGKRPSSPLAPRTHDSYIPQSRLGRDQAPRRHRSRTRSSRSRSRSYDRDRDSLRHARSRSPYHAQSRDRRRTDNRNRFRRRARSPYSSSGRDSPPPKRRRRSPSLSSQLSRGRRRSPSKSRSRRRHGRRSPSSASSRDSSRSRRVDSPNDNRRRRRQSSSSVEFTLKGGRTGDKKSMSRHSTGDASLRGRETKDSRQHNSSSHSPFSAAVGSKRADDSEDVPRADSAKASASDANDDEETKKAIRRRSLLKEKLLREKLLQMRSIHHSGAPTSSRD